MIKQYKKALFIFRRDLRLDDNTALLHALESAETVIPCFIFTPEQLENNPYRSERCLQFMIESLEDLEEQLAQKGARLFLFFGAVEQIVEKLLETERVDAVFINNDYTPYSLQRDQKLLSLCEKKGTLLHSFDDALLHPPSATLKANGLPYTVFTPFYKNALKLTVETPLKNSYTNYFTQEISFAENSSIYHKILSKRFPQQKGGRRQALSILSSIKEFAHYAQERDFPDKQATTHLSPHLKFTTCSIREVYLSCAKAFGKECPLIRSLYWRDFFSCIAFYFPHVFEGAFHQHFNNLSWTNNPSLFEKWCRGKTGFPLIDAGMRELLETGFMHNRVRMLAASFLVKDLHIDWRWGERYFAQKLIDYDPAVNNGNWQWAASTGCDAQPYFRIFNPLTQQKKFDPECRYIKRYLPEVASLSAQTLHNWPQTCHNHSDVYIVPVIDHALESKRTLGYYKKIRKE